MNHWNRFEAQASRAAERPDRKAEKGQESQAQEYINEVESPTPSVPRTDIPQDQIVEREGTKTYEAFADHYMDPAP